MSILKEAWTKGTDELKPIRVKIDCSNLNDEAPERQIYPPHARKYLLCVDLYCEFWANRAQFETAKKQAMNVLSHTIYKDCLNRIHELRLAVMNEEPEVMLGILNQLEDDIKI